MSLAPDFERVTPSAGTPVEFAPTDYHAVVGSDVSGSTLTIRFRPYDQPSEIDLERLENAF